MWVARNEDGSLGLYKTEPRRVKVSWFEKHVLQKKDFWSGFLILNLKKDSSLFNDLTWNDEPRKVFVGIFDRNRLERMFRNFGITPTYDLVKWMEENVGGKR